VLARDIEASLTWLVTQEVEQVAAGLRFAPKEEAASWASCAVSLDAVCARSLA
jgi:hypothetical protein